jgi:glutamine cyclotransferase
MGLSRFSMLSLCCLLSVLAVASAQCSSTAPERELPVSPGETRGSADAAQTTGSTATSGYEIVAIHPHDTNAYTQGLFWHDGYLYEGTGRYGTSWLRKVDPDSGEVLQQASLPAEYFGEGIALLGARIFQLTWLSKRGFVYDAASLERIGEFAYDTEGWGLTTDGEQLIISDGSENLFFFDPPTQEVTRTVRVHENGQPVRELNELEYVGGLVYANVWHSDFVLKIDPDSGAVVGRVDLSGLLAGERPRDAEAVLNGIAYNPDDGHLFVTGKLWPYVFEIRLTPSEHASR